MNLEREYIFSCIEEDNIQRAYFRIHPLLTVDGDVASQAEKRWPNDGCLRIVPDRGEQRTFKERMRAMNGWCAVDLSCFPPEANKIRTNKNYHPEQGEVNQFIVYSDAVKSLSDKVFYEVLSGDAADFEALAAKAVTPRFFIQSGDTLFGPVDRANPTQPETASEAEAVLYTVKDFSEIEHTILCLPGELVRPQIVARPVQRMAVPVAAPAAVPAVAAVPVGTIVSAAPAVPDAAAEVTAAPDQKTAAEGTAAENAEASAPASTPTSDEALPIGKPLEILDQEKTFEETLNGLNQPVSNGANLLHQAADHAQSPAQTVPTEPLSGTPLYRSQVKTSIPQPKNRLQEVVASQWRVVRNEPPCQPLPTGCTMKRIDNPVQDACEALRAAWAVPEAQTQLIDFILSLDGMTAKMEPRAGKRYYNSPLQEAIQSRLNDLEAERLASLVELDKAKADLDEYRKNAMESASEKAKKELAALEQDRDAMQQAVEQLKEQANALIAQRDELAKRVDEMASQEIPARVTQLFADCAVAMPPRPSVMRLSPVSGVSATLEEMTSRVEKLCKTCELTYQKNKAVALLVALGISGRIGMAAPAPAAAATFVRGLCAAMGWTSGFGQQVTLDQHPLLACKPTDSTPAVLLTSLASYAPYAGVTKLMLVKNVPMMVRNVSYETEQWPIFPLGIAKFVPETSWPGVAPVAAASLDALLACGKTPDDEIDRVLAPVLSLIPPLSGRTKVELRKFVSACTELMDGGLAAACDWAVMLWVLPALERNPRVVNEMKAALTEYPMSLEMLGE